MDGTTNTRFSDRYRERKNSGDFARRCRQKLSDYFTEEANRVAISEASEATDRGTGPRKSWGPSQANGQGGVTHSSLCDKSNKTQMTRMSGTNSLSSVVTV